MMFAEVAPTSALVDRVPPGALAKNGGTVDERLGKVMERAEGPFSAHLVAVARLALAERRGDVKAAEAMRARTGCIRDATLLGPVSFTPVSSVADPTQLDHAGVPAPSEVAGPGPFMPKARATAVRALGCHIPLYAQSNAQGVRELIVDVEVPRAGWIGVGLRANNAAVVRAGGQIAVDRE